MRATFERNLGIAIALAAFAALPAQAAERDGAALFELCAQCHGADGSGREAFLAPNLTGLPDWYLLGQLRNFHSGLRGMHPDDTAGLRMYPMAKTFAGDTADADMQAVVAHITKLPVVVPEPTFTDGDPAKGQAFYQVCTACHGPDGKGNQALGSPPLTHESDWYLLSSLKRYKDGVRSNDPRNANAQLMRGMAATLPDEQAMKDVIAYIRSLGAGQAAAAPAPAPGN
jgi:cytochrome c oxidase subunit 2